MPTIGGNSLTDAGFAAGKIVAASHGISLKQFNVAFARDGHDRTDALLALNNLLDTGIAEQRGEEYFIADAYIDAFRHPEKPLTTPHTKPAATRARTKVEKPHGKTRGGRKK